VSSSAFERQVIDSGSSDSRPTHSPNRAPDGPQQYTPSASFLDHDRPSSRLVELPAWLQSFAASVGEPDTSGAPGVEVVDLPEATVGTDKTFTQPAEEPASRERQAAPGAGLATSFISEDDLPEWLRAIAPHDAGDGESELFQFGGGSSDAPASVPSVTRAWSTSKDARGVDEATSLFALVASQGPQTAIPSAHGARQQAQRIPSRAETARADNEQGVVDSYGSSVPPGFEQRLPQLDVERAPAAAQEVKGAFPLLPVLVAGVLLIILLLVAAVMFLS
jgi:hypothetical protein